MTGMRVLLVDAQSGISGDMFVAAAAPLAGCEDAVRALPAKLGLAGVVCSFADASRGGIRARRFHVDDRSEPSVGQGHHPTPAHRPLSQILAMIEEAGLAPNVTGRAMRMFRTLGEVEATMHGVPIEAVHFHEVGAVDSIVDITAAALCIESLASDAVFTTTVCTGSGNVRTAHGILPVPAPATERLLQGLPTEPGALEGEWTTPTGALILHDLGARAAPPALIAVASAYGAGGRDPTTRPNVLRLRLCETEAASTGLERDTVAVIRCNIDDAPSEQLGADLVAALLEAGALDVTIAPVVMKKGRPGHIVEVLCELRKAEALGVWLLENTRSIGVRISAAERRMLRRRPCVLDTAYGPVTAKEVRLPDGTRRVKPEYESCVSAAHEHGVPVQDVHAAALAAARARASSVKGPRPWQSES